MTSLSRFLLHNCLYTRNLGRLVLAVPFVLHQSTSETCQRLALNELVTHAKIEEKMKRMNAKAAARSLNEIFFHRIPCHWNLLRVRIECGRMRNPCGKFSYRPRVFVQLCDKSHRQENHDDAETTAWEQEASWLGLEDSAVDSSDLERY